MALFKSFNSKGFLLLYLVAFASLLLAWLVQMEKPGADRRDIPVSLRSELVSPPRQIPQFLLRSTDNQVLTEQALRGKWSFIYFSHAGCLPHCEPVLAVLGNLKQMLTNREQQFVLINFDSEDSGDMSSLLEQLDAELSVFSGDVSMLAMLMKTFGFLYLPAKQAQGKSIEQQHSIFLIDPRGRLYARFEPPFSSLSIQQSFFQLRDFYARSE